MVEIGERAVPESEGEQREEDMRERGRAAFDAGDYVQAFNLFQSSVLDQGLRWFREEGVTFQRPPGPLTAKQLAVGLAIAAEKELAARGEDASHKLSTATWLFNAVAQLRRAMEEDVPDTTEAKGLKMAELMSLSVMLGQLDGMMNAINLGWLDKLAEYEMGRERRRAGAMKVNAAKATAKERALGEAMRIASRNPTLSNEELALKVRDAASVQTSIRTVTDWVREWRRKDFLRPQTKPAR